MRWDKITVKRLLTHIRNTVLNDSEIKDTAILVYLPKRHRLQNHSCPYCSMLMSGTTALFLKQLLVSQEPN